LTSFGEPVLSATETILIVAAESAFRRSLEFALEVEGYLIESYAQWEDAAQSPAATSALCAVVDDGALSIEADELESLERITGPIIMLSDGFSVTEARAGMTVLTKPLRGNDLIDMVHKLSATHG
jgi:FixJ family two-component response regulator